MKTFLEISKQTLNFSNCNDCASKCCDGREGTIFSHLILEDFEVVSKHFPILFTFGDMGYLKAVVLFSDGTGFCPYIKEHKCTIYDERPSICRVYPLSPNVDDKIYIDDSCPAINMNDGKTIIDNGIVTKDFNYPTLKNYQDKYVETHFELATINDKNDFTSVASINNITFYKYTGQVKNKYINYHLTSLKNNSII